MAEYTPQEWADGDPTKPPSGARFAYIEAGLVKASIPTKVTSLPVTPYDGQEVYYEALGGTGIAYWHLRYRSASASAFKWEFLGGPGLRHEVDTEEAVGSTGSWVNLATNGPTLTLPLAGDYKAEATLGVVNVAGAAIVTGRFGVSRGGGLLPVYEYGATIMAAGNAQTPGSFIEILPALPAASVVKLLYQGTTTAVAFKLRRLTVTPIRVG